MKRRAHALCRAAAMVLTVTLWLAPAKPVQSKTDQPALDHLKCYRIQDDLAPATYLADLRNQFGVEPGCQIRVPARLFCVETEKRNLPP